MSRTMIALVVLGGLLAVAPLPAQAQSNAPATGATAIPNRATAPPGTHRTRERHRNTLNRQRARATAAHASHVRANRPQ